MSSATTHRFPSAREAGWSVVAALASLLRAAMAFPTALFLLTLTVMLFRPPDFEFYSLDRFAFLLLVAAVLLRTLVLRKTFHLETLTWPMLGLTVLAVVSALSHPFEAKTWSVVAAKFIVPFAFFHLAGLIFESEDSLRWLERFSLVVLAYLSLTSVAFMAGAHELVFPRFILDQSLGIHADRARGPFLQAVANGVTLNFLGLIALERYRRGQLRGVWAVALLGPLPFAIVATKTRSVWLSFAVSVGWLLSLSNDFAARRTRKAILVMGFIGVAALLGLSDVGAALGDRLHESSPVEFRMAAYRAGWSMFLERPVLGWGTSRLQEELARRISGFRGEIFAVHNTYFEILVEHGVPGIAFYFWLVVGLARLGRDRGLAANEGFLGSIQRLWLLLLGVDLVNATFVVMNYQFVNGMLFTFAGILAASKRRVARGEDLNGALA